MTETRSSEYMMKFNEPASNHVCALRHVPEMVKQTGAPTGRKGLATLTARMVWVVMARGERYTEPALLAG